jgi:hypothetical protein
MHLLITLHIRILCSFHPSSATCRIVSSYLRSKNYSIRPRSISQTFLDNVQSV